MADIDANTAIEHLAQPVGDGIDAAGLKGVLAAYRAQSDADGLSPAPGCRVVVAYANADAVVEIPLPDTWRVRGDDRLIDDLRAQSTVRTASFAYA